MLQRRIEEMNKEEARVDRKETRRHEELNLVLDESPWLDGGEEDPGDALICGQRKREASSKVLSDDPQWYIETNG